MLKKYAPALIGGAILLVGSVAGWQFYQSMKTDKIEQDAVLMQQAQTSFDETQDIPELNNIVANGTPGYKAMALLQIASHAMENDDQAGAMNAYRQVINMDGLPKRVKSLATLRASYLALDMENEDPVTILAGLDSDTTIFGAQATEVLALNAMAQKDYEAAVTHFTALKDHESATDLISRQADEFLALARLGQSGVVLEAAAFDPTANTSIENLFQAADEFEKSKGKFEFVDGDRYQTASAGIGSYELEPGSRLRFDIDKDAEVVGQAIEVSFTANLNEKATEETMFEVAYFTNEAGNSGWQSFTPTAQPQRYSFIYDVPEMENNELDKLRVRSNFAGAEISDISYRILPKANDEAPEEPIAE